MSNLQEEIPVHEAADIFPMLETNELQKLADSIKERGQHQPIILFEGKILDGRNRLAACRLAGVEPRFEVRKPSDDESPWDLVWDLNVERRHLDMGRQGSLFLLKEEGNEAWLAEKGKIQEEANRARSESQKGRPKKKKTDEIVSSCIHCGDFEFSNECCHKERDPSNEGRRSEKTKRKKGKNAGPSTSTAAKRAGVSAATIERAKELKAKAPDLFDAVCKGKLKLGAAKKELTKRTRQAELEEAKKKLAAEKVAKKFSEFVDLRVCSMQDLLSSKPKIDAIITDPPYPEEYVSLYGEMARLAKDVLGDHGIMAVMCGQSYLDRILHEMAQHIPYRWTLAYLTPGGQAVQLWDRKVNTFWKPILLFGAKPEWTGDVVKSDVNDNDKRFHGWGQSESGMLSLVEALTKPGQVVCDPFMGAGTTGVVAVSASRRFIGCDIDAQHVETSKGRIAEVMLV